MENEVFTEAVPTTLIMTFLMAVLVVSNTFRGDDGAIDPDTHLLAGFGIERYLFKVTFFTSALSAGLGLAKCLKVRYLTYKKKTFSALLNIFQRWDLVVSWQKVAVWAGFLLQGFNFNLFLFLALNSCARISVFLNFTGSCSSLLPVSFHWVGRELHWPRRFVVITSWNSTMDTRFQL